MDSRPEEEDTVGMLEDVRRKQRRSYPDGGRRTSLVRSLSTLSKKDTTIDPSSLERGTGKYQILDENPTSTLHRSVSNISRAVGLQRSASRASKKSISDRTGRACWEKWVFIGSFIVLNAGLIIMVFFVRFELYVWLLSLSNTIRSLCVLAIILGSIWEGFKNWRRKDKTALLAAEGAAVASKNVLCILPCYTESRMELQRTLDSFAEQATTKNNPNITIAVIVDGLATGKGNDQPTWEICASILGAEGASFDEFTYKSWKRKTLLVKAIRGYWRNVPYVLLIKNKNCGKKDGLIMIRELVLGFNGGRDRGLGRFGHWFAESINVNAGWSTIDYLVGTDADTVITPSSVYVLVKKMLSNDKLLGVSGFVKADLSMGSCLNPWIAYQFFEYVYGQYLTRFAQAIFRKVTCLPGCIQIVSADPKLFDVPLDKFSTLPNPDSLFESVVAFLGEDRRFTCLALYENPNHHTGMSFEAVGLTGVPPNSRVFFSQRRRWFLSAQANNIRDTLNSNLPFTIRLIAASQILASAIVPFIFVAVVYFITRMAINGTNRYWMLFIGSASLVWVYKFFLMVTYPENLKEVFVMFYGFLLQTLFSAPIQAYNTIHALKSMDDMGWGLTRQVSMDFDEIKVDTAAGSPPLREVRPEPVYGLETAQIANPLLPQ
ncbi:chitin synthase [Spizellomyces sp. 'palustris']|nr:chitin synthase [Spizellomyces sp. 'palustris']